MQRRLRFFVIASLALVPALAIAWTGPTQTAPNGNVAAPINTGSSAQVKSGDFAILGNVGIGTPSPIRKLDIANGLTSAGNGSARVFGYQAAFEVFNNAGTANWYFGNNDANNNSLYIGRGYGPNQGIAPDIAITQGGNVGVGTVSPSYKLHVAGDMIANGWLRTAGNAGWYSETYGGGWYMQDTTWVRVVNNRNVYTGGQIRGDGGIAVGGYYRPIGGPLYGYRYEYNPGGNDLCPGDDLVYGVGVYNYQVGNLCTNNGCIASYNAGTTIWCVDVY